METENRKKMLPEWWRYGDKPWIIADAITGLKMLPDASVHCCVTSPPYWGLRDYGTATWVGGDPSCEHSCGSQIQDNKAPGAITTGVRPGCDASVCLKCGAMRVDAQIGLEPTPEAYVDDLVAVFREVRRVLRSDGTLWLNLGDSYAGGGKHDEPVKYANCPKPERPRVQNLKPKDLVGIPWRVAFALQADGWYLRSDIIWSKPNPMPESVTDRPTKSHEYIFLLTKSAKYYYDSEAVKEDSCESTLVRDKYTRSYEKQNGISRDWQGAPEGIMDCSGGRNRRTVWTVATKPFSGAHFATYPTELITPMILAGTSERGCCPTCGSPWERIVEREKPPAEVYTGKVKPDDIAAVSHPELGLVGMGGKLQAWYESHPPRTVGWKPSCGCDREPIPCVVIDPFLGSGTTIEVARSLNRIGIGIELNPNYESLITKRAKPGLSTIDSFGGE